MIVLRELAPAKINLYLHVTGIRPDGYHLIDSLVVFTDTGDKLEVIPASGITLTLAGPYASGLSAKDNSVMRAAEALRKHAGVKAGAALTLHKHLPVAAGMGGGSADAAAALRLLTRFWKLKLPSGDLMALALSLGADGPACLKSAALYMGGIGERLEDGPPLAGMPLVLVNPGRPLATSEVFAAREGDFSVAPRHPQAFASYQACAEFLRKAHSDLQEPALRLMPEIAAVLDALHSQKDCLLARMSGSGATCFGIFAHAQAAQNAAAAVAGKYPKWWVKAAAVQ